MLFNASAVGRSDSFKPYSRYRSISISTKFLDLILISSSRYFFGTRRIFQRPIRILSDRHSYSTTTVQWSAAHSAIARCCGALCTSVYIASMNRDLLRCVLEEQAMRIEKTAALKLFEESCIENMVRAVAFFGAGLPRHNLRPPQLLYSTRVVSVYGGCYGYIPE